MGAGGGFHADNEELNRLATTLRDSGRTMDAATEAPPAVADAGPSTPLVQEAISQLTKGAAGLRGGVQQAAENVSASAATYRRSDEAGKDRLHGAGNDEEGR